MSENQPSRGSTSAGESVDLSAVKRRARAAEDNLTKLIAAQKLTGRIKLGVVLTLFGLIAIWVFLVYNLFSGFDVTAFQTAATKEADRIWPELHREFSQIANRVIPVYSKEMAKQTEGLGDRLSKAFKVQIDRFKKQQDTLLRKKFDDQVVAAEKRHAKHIVEAFPQLAKKPKQVKELVDLMHKRIYEKAHHELVKAIDGNVQAMLALRKTFDGLGGKGGRTLMRSPEEMLSAWIELLDFKLSLDPHGPKKPKKKPGREKK